MKQLIFFVILLFIFSKNTYADEINCNDRYLTLVNPVRSREIWFDKSVEPLKQQYNLILANNFDATWLLQYDVLIDVELVQEVKNFNSTQELGVFLEISKKLGDQAKVVYPYDAAWFYPRAVFLSGYSQSDRRRLIDEMFKKFKSTFGYFPKSVGAWWIDSYSLDYMKEKYDISAALIVADQLSTDDYGVWGQWWGVPYFSSKQNILTPASPENNQQVAIIQWAQRDPYLAYGDTPAYSNYSLQANDYIRQGKDTNYFAKLVDSYLSCQNKLGQVTVGLETGLESVGFIDEYEKQLEYLKGIKSLLSVTMSEFASYFEQIYPNIKQLELMDENERWILKKGSRSNQYLGDFINYSNKISFSDYFVADNSRFLDRRLPSENLQKNISWFPWYILVVLSSGILSIRKKKFREWFLVTVFIFASSGLILKSNYQFGWKVFFGPVLENLIIWQIVIVFLVYFFFWVISKKITNFLYWIVLSFGIDTVP